MVNGVVQKKFSVILPKLHGCFTLKGPKRNNPIPKPQCLRKKPKSNNKIDLF